MVRRDPEQRAWASSTIAEQGGRRRRQADGSSPLVATSDAHYLTREDAPAHDVLLCINTGKTLDDPNRMKFDTQEFFVRSPDEMYAAMPGHEEALAMTTQIANLVEPNYTSLGLGSCLFSLVPAPAGETRRPKITSARFARSGWSSVTARTRRRPRANGSEHRESWRSSAGWASRRTS